MKKGKIINIVLVAVAVALLAVFAPFVRISPVADNVAVLETNGMTCGTCRTGIEEALEKNRGVASVEVDVTGGWVVVGYDSKQASPGELAATVTGQGYRTRVARVLTIEQFRAIAGRYPGNGMMAKSGCGCDAGK